VELPKRIIVRAATQFGRRITMPDHENRAAPSVPDRSGSLSLAYPPSCVTTGDRARLLALLSAEGDSANRIVRRALIRKLWLATICAPDALPADVVTMHSRVIYRRHIGEPSEERRLCFSDENVPASSALPILTPLGTAMLGLRAGSSASYEIAGGIRLSLVVERVAYQPEAAQRYAGVPVCDWPSSRRSGGTVDARAAGVPFGTGDGEVLSLTARVRTRPIAVDPDDDPGPQAA
jgi:regulator of nucleoside diphosphate kinase